jgi:hypothetical protein
MVRDKAQWTRLGRTGRASVLGTRTVPRAGQVYYSHMTAGTTRQMTRTEGITRALLATGVNGREPVVMAINTTISTKTKGARQCKAGRMERRVQRQTRTQQATQ